MKSNLFTVTVNFFLLKMFLVFDPIDKQYFVVGRYIPYHWRIIKELNPKIQQDVHNLVDKGIYTFVIRNKGVARKVKIKLNDPRRVPLLEPSLPEQQQELPVIEQQQE